MKVLRVQVDVGPGSLRGSQRTQTGGWNKVGWGETNGVEGERLGVEVLPVRGFSVFYGVVVR